MKKIIYLVSLVLIALIFTGCEVSTPPQDISSQNEEDSTPMNNLQFPGILSSEKITNKKAVITTSKGTIEIKLLSNQAPNTVSNFVYLTQKAFYNGLTFHRVEPGFVIQGGDPNGNGTGGPGYKFEDEKVIGEYKKGSVAMANSGSNTNGSQFFICLDNQPNLPKLYNLFGEVTKGMDVVEKIEKGDKMDKITIENE